MIKYYDINNFDNNMMIQKVFTIAVIIVMRILLKFRCESQQNYKAKVK